MDLSAFYSLWKEQPGLSYQDKYGEPTSVGTHLSYTKPAFLSWLVKHLGRLPYSLPKKEAVELIEALLDSQVPGWCGDSDSATCPRQIPKAGISPRGGLDVRK